MTGVQTLVPFMLDHVDAGPAHAGALRRSHQRRAARMFGIAGKGRIAAGYDADFTIVDLKRRETIRDHGSPRDAAGRLTTARQSPDGRSGPSCAAGG